LFAIIILLVPLTLIGIDLPSWAKYPTLLLLGFFAYGSGSAWNETLDAADERISTLRSFPSAVLFGTTVMIGVAVVYAATIGIEATLARARTDDWSGATFMLLVRTPLRMLASGFIAGLIAAPIDAVAKRALNGAAPGGLTRWR